MKPWIGLIRLVNGRRQEGGHPCCGWLTPPLHPAGGRESETFAMVLELNGPATSRLYREIRDAIARSFWSTSGSPIAALRRAVIAANRVLFHFNNQIPAESRCWGSLACAALRPDEIFLAMVGRAWARIFAAEIREQYPEQHLPPLGSRAWAEVAITYSPIRPGLTLLITPQNLPDIVALDALDTVLQRENEEILDGLEQLAGGESLTALVVQWPEEGASPPEPPPRRRKAPRAVETPAALIPPLPEEEIPREPVSVPAGSVWETIVKEAEVSTTIPESRPWEAEAPHRAAPGVPAPSAGLRRLGGALIGGLSAVGRAVGRGMRAIGGGLRAAGFAIYRGSRTLFRRAIPGTEHRRAAAPRQVRLPPAENPRLMAALAIIILILVALVTLLAWFRYGRDLRKGSAVSLAWEHVQAARQAPSPDLARPHWEAVLTALADYDDPQAMALRTMAQDALDTMDGVTRVSPVLVADLSPTSGRRLAVWEQSVAVLEERGQVRHILIGGESETVPVSEEAPLMDIARYQPEAGRTAPMLLILGRGARLWAYDSRWAEARPLALSPPPGGHEPVAMSTYQGRLYLLDPAAGQIWRYRSRDEQFQDPEPYFSEAPPLTDARDLAIDGNIYVLFENGQVARYLEGKVAPFAVTGVPPPPPHFIALAVDQGLTDGPVYLADGAAERIVVLKASGAFCAQLRAPGGEFRGLRALTVSDTGNDLFILAGGKVYRIPILSLPCR